ncbi:MAG TPA: ABC transporter substrate-binding protein [Candidatus Ventricola gallistercoris]|nr:ABC transporter substrate-binding protein [Candidatus Ventricola gallistercoris]
MKKLISVLVCVLLAVCLSVCAVAEDKPFAGQTLTISTFSFNAELLQKNIYDPFEELTGCTLVVDSGNNAQRVTKIIESPDDYDVVIIGDMFVKQLMDAGVIDTIDSSKLTNLEALYETARAPMGEDYGPAYTFNRLGIVYDSAYCDVEIKSWADLWNPDLADSIAIPDMTATSGPLFYYATAEAFGLTPGTDDEAIFAKLEELKPNVVKTYTSANDTITMLNQGEISVAVLLDYSYTTAKNANPDYVWVDPVEGSFSGYNMLNVIKGTEVKDLAEAFIDFYLSYDVQLAEALDGVDSPVRTDVELTEEQAANFTYGEEIVSALRLPDWDVISAHQADWIDNWNAIFSVQ